MGQALDIDWLPILALPGLDLTSAVGCELAVLSPAHDPRVQARRRQDRDLDAFLDRFADTFGEQFEPALLLIAESAPEAAFQAEAVTGFRDVVALAGIMPAWARAIQNGRALEPLWADAYDFFPWMVSKEGDGLIGQSAALLGAHDIAALQGQSSPLLGLHANRYAVLRAALEAKMHLFTKRHQDPAIISLGCFTRQKQGFGFSQRSRMIGQPRRLFRLNASPTTVIVYR